MILQDIHNFCRILYGARGTRTLDRQRPGPIPTNSGWYPTKLDDSPCIFIKIITSFKLVYYNSKEIFVKFIKQKTKDTFLLID